MGFGGGSSNTSSSSETASWASNFLNSMSSQSGSTNSQSSSAIDPTQQGFLQNLWGQGQAQANPAAATATANSLVGSTMPGLQQSFGALGKLADPGKQIAAQAASLKAGLGNLWSDEIAPGLRSNAMGAGGFGGGRQGVAEGVAAGQLGDTYAEGLGDITAQANQTAIGAAGQQGSLGQSIYNLGMMPGMAGMQQLLAQSSLLGGPAILSQATSRSKSTGKSTSQGGGSSKSRGSAKGNSSSWNLSAQA